MPIARGGLDRTGHHRVEVIEGDAAVGWPPNAPYDLIIATVGVHDLPHVWLEQLAPGGRLVVPMRLRGSVTRSITWQLRDGVWTSVSSAMCGFVPLRGGIADDPRAKIDLTGDGSVQLHLHQDQQIDPAVLHGILDRPSHEAWTGVIFRPMVSFEWMYLWSTLALPNGLSSLDTNDEAVEDGLVRPAFKAACMAAVIGDDLAYMTMRRFPDPDDPAVSLAEIGVIGHGAHPAAVAERYADAIREWAATVPGEEAQFTYYPDATSGRRSHRQHITLPGGSIGVDWTQPEQQRR